MATAIRPNLADIAATFSAESDERIKQLTTRVALIKASKVDAVADTRALTAIAVKAGDNHPAQVLIQAPNGMKMQVGEVAHDQFAQRLKIDRRYYDRMVSEAPELLAQNLNWWLTHTPEERLLRMLKPDALSPEDRAIMASLGAVVRRRCLRSFSIRRATKSLR